MLYGLYPYRSSHSYSTDEQDKQNHTTCFYGCTCGRLSNSLTRCVDPEIPPYHTLTLEQAFQVPRLARMLVPTDVPGALSA